MIYVLVSAIALILLALVAGIIFTGRFFVRQARTDRAAIESLVEKLEDRERDAVAAARDAEIDEIRLKHEVAVAELRGKAEAENVLKLAPSITGETVRIFTKDDQTYEGLVYGDWADKLVLTQAVHVHSESARTTLAGLNDILRENISSIQRGV